MSLTMEDKDKPILSHTLSLPSPQAPVASPNSPTHKEIQANNRPIQQKFRSKSVRQKPTSNANSNSPSTSSSNRVWSFGDMAKAVGCGVTAFGSGVVSGSKAVGSGVIQGSVAVGTNVVEGTKVAGRMTKDVTMAAGKGVVQAGELVVDTGKSVTSASVNAVQDTTKWVIAQAELDGVDLVHNVTPGEDIAKLSETYNVPIHKIIKVNKLSSRYLSVGREIVIPKNDQLQRALSHPMDTLHLNCALLGEKESYRVEVTFEPTELYISRSMDSTMKSIAIEELESITVEKATEEDERMPELLPVKDLPDPILEEEEDDESGSNHDKKTKQTAANTTARVAVGAAGAAAVDDDNDNWMIISFRPKENGCEPVTKLKLSSNEMFQVLNHIDLWYPEKLDPNHSLANLDSNHINFDDFIGGGSHILTKKIMKNMHLCLPSAIQSAKWNILYSTVLDGYSLQNFYRKVAQCNEPMVLVIEDTDGDIYGAYLTCIPTVTEEFTGTGESWLFKVNKEDHSHVKKYEWSKENEYFFQGKANCMIIGACDGKFGIYIDGNIHHGRIEKCMTFAGWPDKEKDVQIRHFECFNFVV